jgi:signal transduction histidine kinase
MGFYLMLFLLFILLFFMFGENKAALYFALFCFMWFFRVGVTEGKVLTSLMPWLDWHIKFRIEYISIPVACLLYHLVINTLFPKLLHKKVLWGIYSVTAVFIVIFLFADTVFMSHAVLVCYAVYATVIMYLIACFVIRLRKINMPQGIFITGMGLFFFATIADFLFYSGAFPIAKNELTGIAFLLFALCQATAVFITTVQEIEEAKAEQRRLAAETDFYKKMSHRLLTPLTIVSTNIQVAQSRPHEADVLLTESQDEIMKMSDMINSALSEKESGVSE